MHAGELLGNTLGAVLERRREWVDGADLLLEGEPVDRLAGVIEQPEEKRLAGYSTEEQSSNASTLST